MNDNFHTSLGIFREAIDRLTREEAIQLTCRFWADTIKELHARMGHATSIAINFTHDLEVKIEVNPERHSAGDRRDHPGLCCL